MHRTILAFILGSILVGLLPTIDYLQYMLLLVPICCCGLCFSGLRGLSGLCLGVVFAVVVGHQSLKHRLPVELEGKDLVVEGYVSSLPQRRERGIRFSFRVLQKEGIALPDLVVLNWYAPDRDSFPSAGEKWRFVVRLVRPHGFVNPGLFGYEAWLLTNGISATGYIRQDDRNLRLRKADLRSLHHQIREKLREGVLKTLPDDDIRGVLIALLIGESAQISKAIWRVLSNTGTNHLLIISGLHVGFIAGMVLALLRLILRRIVKSWQLIACVLTIVIAIGYGSLAGFGLPVQRALVMVSIGLVAFLSGRIVTVWIIFLYALFTVTAANPFASLGAGYWLSFGAVASLAFFFSGRSDGYQGVTSRVRTMLQAQWIVFVGTAPLLICWVMQVSLVAFVVNLVAIPFISFLIVPLLLIALPFLYIGIEPGPSLIESTHYFLVWFIDMLAFFAELDLVYRRPGTDLLPILLACLGSLILLSPTGLSPKWLGLVLVLPVFAPYKPATQPEDLLVQVLDVGQGLSVVIKTKNHAVVYDTGPAFGSRFDAGEQIVAPALRSLGQADIHTLVLSHGDIDHSGGLAGLIAQIPVQQVLASNLLSDRLLPRKPGQWIGCSQGQRWSLDGVHFEVLLGGSGQSENDRSCVLLVESEWFSMILPGDIEKDTEALLLNHDLPIIDVMVSPHHGSLSSSSPAFLNRIRPATIVVSAGYRNRFNHPHPTVLARYRARDIRVLNTAETGSILIHVEGSNVKMETARSTRKRFWYD